MPLEIERKFLIRMPNVSLLATAEGGRVLMITQTYLNAREGVAARVRLVREGDSVRYIRTEKQRVSARTAIENEWALSEEEYLAALAEVDKTRKPIEKTRYAIPYADHTLEIDIYPFWRDRAILEVELKDEDEEFLLPPYIKVIAEVTDDKRYKNVQLAKAVPQDVLPPEEE